MGKDMDSVPCGMKMNRNEARKRHATRNGRIIPLQQKQQLSSNDLAVLTPANNNAPLPPPPPPPPTPFASEIIIIPANRKHSPGRGGGKRRSWRSIYGCGAEWNIRIHIHQQQPEEYSSSTEAVGWQKDQLCFCGENEVCANKYEKSHTLKLIWFLCRGFVILFLCVNNFCSFREQEGMTGWLVEASRDKRLHPRLPSHRESSSLFSPPPSSPASP